MLKKLPPINTFPQEILTEEFKDICKDYNNSLKKVARINNTSRIIIDDTNKEIEKLAKRSKRLSNEIDKNKDKFTDEFSKSIADSTEKFTENFFEAQEKSKGYAEDQDMTAYIDSKKHEISCVETRMNADFKKDYIYDTKEKIQIKNIMTDLDADIQRSEEANKVFIRHNDYDDALRALNTMKADLKKYRDFIGNKNPSGKKTEREVLLDTEKKAMALRESADEAARKMEAYLERKGNQGHLNEKGQRRVEVFKKALETTKKIAHICDDRLIETGSKIISIDKDEILKIEADHKASAYEKEYNDESKSNIEKLSAKAAYLSIQSLKELAPENRELNEEETTLAREAIACIIVHEKKLFDPKSNPTIDEFGKQISLFANDPSFGRAVDISPAGIRDFIASADINKEASRIHSRLMQDKSKEKQAQADIKENVDKPQQPHRTVQD